MSDPKYEFATYYRVLGTIFILLCHFTAQSSSSLINMSAQFFNIGVEMFIILSGFLFGMRGGYYKNPTDWIMKRLKRIYVPYELFVFVLLIIHVLCGRNVFHIDWFWFILGLQGSVVGVLGGEQTWFITAILLCYALTPGISYLYERALLRKTLCAILIATPTVLALVPPAFIHTLGSLVCWYGLAYIIGQESDRIRVFRKNAILAFTTMCASFGIRLLTKMLCDGTIMYERIVVGYTQTVAALAIFYLVFYFTRSWKPNKIIDFIGKISFEIYLYHYMFCVGPIRLFGVINNWIVNCGVVTLLTVVIAIIMNYCGEYFSTRIEK